ncbi:integrase catalytic domain-containing protein [Trichonephila clavipes]|uniref:Integrase catalytic domain-containing protein n=1 Tax=Trichonephila clavipes TaxID=2585209 RepID=A0A8X7BAD9_TRICX|nr:integrase catalytic domain-containing protein [Trichonephila clavipes]
MMFRQILIYPAQCDLLRIMWKTGANEEPVIYRLKPVTYGTASAPFFAIRTLRQLAMDESSRFPLASKVALQDMYMDDVVSGARNLDTACQLQCQLQNMLETCGMKLHKWNYNSKELLNSSSDQEHSFSTNAESAIKALNIRWKPTGDYFMFKVSIPSIASYTKRDVLSVIARLNAPLGLIDPVISKAKIFLQKLWVIKLKWEEFLPDAIAPEWLNFVSCLKALEELKTDRYVLTDSYGKLILLGYADASESEYGAVVYMHSVKENGTTTTKHISSKFRVAPIKVISIARLELSACLLLAQLVEKVRPFLQVHLAKVLSCTPIQP